MKNICADNTVSQRPKLAGRDQPPPNIHHPPPSTLPPLLQDEPPSVEALEVFWAKLASAAVGEAGEAAEVLSAEQWGDGLQKLTGQEHGAMWKDFKLIAQAA